MSYLQESWVSRGINNTETKKKTPVRNCSSTNGLGLKETKTRPFSGTR